MTRPTDLEQARAEWVYLLNCKFAILDLLPSCRLSPDAVAEMYFRLCEITAELKRIDFTVEYLRVGGFEGGGSEEKFDLAPYSRHVENSYLFASNKNLVKDLKAEAHTLHLRVIDLAEKLARAKEKFYRASANLNRYKNFYGILPPRAGTGKINLFERV